MPASLLGVGIFLMLTICPTPIGNLGDVTKRQLEALSSADIIACEDTRVTGKLLELLGVARVDGRPQLVSYHDHNAHERAPMLVARMEMGEHVTLVSDAGTPGLADPGFRLVGAAREAGIEITALPGPFAGAVALSACGLPTDDFRFGGFLPQKGAARSERLEELLGSYTTVLYEAPARVLKLLEELQEVAPDRRVSLCRELTKQHEEWLQGTPEELVVELSGRDKVRGEFVVCIEGASRDDSERVREIVQALVDEGLSPKTIKSLGERLTGRKRSEIYALMTELKG